MGLKLQVVKNGKILCEVPLSPREWPREDLESECHMLEEEIEELSKIFEALTNETRMRMMTRLLGEEDFMLSFNDFLRGFNMNPKSVREHAHRLSEAGFLENPGRGKYRLSELGRRKFVAAGLALRRMLNILSEELEW
ncbi:MAG: hypothetical protein GTN80_07740 [Nitrososphaeria archaeon]|nr:hypothetical protein [Nitrososphaeria archaeon]NIN52956.1 hypothetical protein [Nitrososphaeria archaeon]NIQ33515.1 hypothetical protein [Nitrososphaeria archaeon]